MRYLCICAGGIVRSVACAALLRQAGVDAIPVSHKHTSSATLDLLSRWATKIIALEPQFAERIAPEYRSKVIVIDIGPDVWANPLHPDLSKTLMPHIVGLMSGRI